MTRAYTLRNDLFDMGHGHCESDWGHGRGAECSPHNATADRTRARDAADILGVLHSGESRQQLPTFTCTCTCTVLFCS